MNTIYIILIAVGLIVVGTLITLLVSYILHKKQGLSAEENYVRNLLPGIDCGACGCKTCAEFAKKVSVYEKNCDECKVNTFANREKLKRHFEKPLDANIKNVAFIKCKAGNRCEDKYNYLGEQSCQACEKLHSGKKACKAACLGCGDCASICPFNAIKINENGVAVVDATRCTGCEKCVASCPNNLITMIPATQRVAVVCNNTFDDAGIVKSCSVACTRCEICVKTCPVNAISMQNGLPVVDPLKCINCGRCVAACPTKVISKL